MQWACFIRFLTIACHLIGVEAGGHGLDTPDHPASLAGERQVFAAIAPIFAVMTDKSLRAILLA